MKLVIQCLAVGLAGFVGAVARFLVVRGCGRVFGAGFPVGTMVINLSGSFVLGYFLTVIGGRVNVPDTLKLAVATGFVGAYTTFSTLMYESSELIRDGEQIKALVNLVGSFALGMVAVWVGMALARRV